MGRCALMDLIPLLIGACFVSNAIAGCVRKSCISGHGYGCMPIKDCPPRCMALCRSGCRWPSICCNLRKLNACSLAGGTCNATCQLENNRAWCPKGLKCCVYVNR
uniref:Putative carboxypeptidase inhibitor n=1 Tax=Rhipicephalus pulchellus TaxID=72859 RepID=L7M951_RHIPC